MSCNAYVVGVSGGSCSGKSTVTKIIEKELGKKYKVSVFNMDEYYDWSKMKTIAPITRIEYSEHNHPSATDIEKLYKDFTAAISNNTNDVVIVEGIFALYFEQLREKYNLKIFIDLKSDERLYRRIKRALEFDTIDETANRYLDSVRFRHDEFTEPTRWHADLVINGNLDANLGTSILVSYIEAQIGVCQPNE